MTTENNDTTKLTTFTKNTGEQITVKRTTKTKPEGYNEMFDTLSKFDKCENADLGISVKVLRWTRDKLTTLAKKADTVATDIAIKKIQ